MMLRRLSVFLGLWSIAVAACADLVMEQQVSDTNRTRNITVKLHGEKMRLDDPGDDYSVIANLATHDSVTLLTKDKTFMDRAGAEIKRVLVEEKRMTHGTNEMDAVPVAAVDAGKTEMVNGTKTEIYTWAGAHGVTDTLWVATNFPNYNAIQAELLKLDQFNDSGPHRNAQPILSRLPGMVIKSEVTSTSHKSTTTLTSVKIEPVDASQFEIPPGYTAWKPTPKKSP